MHDSVLQTYLRSIGADVRVDLTIDPRDEMFLFTRDEMEGDSDRALVAYVHEGLRTSWVVGDLARWRFGDPSRVKLLDFASGYGRVTRHLVRTFPAGNMTVSDIVAEAVEVQRKQFGVRGVVSTADPSDFVCAERFDLIFVASLFSHLPAETFQAWLAKLVSLTTACGVVAFSVHDRSLLESAGDELPENFVFIPSSESLVLEGSQYGSTWVSEEFVRSSVRAAAPDAAVLRLPKGLGNFQDLYVVAPGGEAGFESLVYDCGPFGHVDHAWIEEGELRAFGWALEESRSASVARVEMWIAGERVATCERMHGREDVASFYGDERRIESGWDLRASVARDISFSDSVFITAASDRGRANLLYAGSLDGLLAHSLAIDLKKMTAERDGLKVRLDEQSRREEAAVAALKLEVSTLKRRIAAMEASRFWKLRRQWFRFKRAVGLPAAE